MPLRAQHEQIVVFESYEARLARTVLCAGAGADAAAMALLEYSDAPTLDAVLNLIARHGAIGEAAFDCVADAWETFRHVRHFSWD